MKKRIFALVLIMIPEFFVFQSFAAQERDYIIRPVGFLKVQLDDSFWAPRLKANLRVTIPHIFKKIDDSGRLLNFELAASKAGKRGETFCTRYPFDDSDVFKTLEAASYALASKRDPGLEEMVDKVISHIASAQEKDGYLYTVRTYGGPPPVDWVGKERWTNLRLSHELYNAGHLYEAAAAHFLATGKRTLLDIAEKNAALLLHVFGPGKRSDPPGHQEVEIGLVKLFRVTEKKEYLDLARFFLECRGKGKRSLYGEYSQDHKPVVEQETAVGHAVRAGYMYTGMADVAALTGEKSYLPALEKIWSDVVGKKIYITGGIGAEGRWEGYGPEYVLPNATAYGETCAAIATCLWNSRMFQLTGESKYVDIMERILYNGLLSGVSLKGDRFFYANPLASFGDHERSEWFSCACCPPNIARILASLPGYVYATCDQGIYINLYVQSKGEFQTGGIQVAMIQTTDYPWSEEIGIEVNPEQKSEFSIFLRIPGWAGNQPVPSGLYTYLDPNEAKTWWIRINGEVFPAELKNGYAVLKRDWKAGDRIQLSLPMPVRRVIANQAVEADRGRVSLERGPLVYCAEGPDNGGRIHHLVLDDGDILNDLFQENLLGGVVTISGEGDAVYQYQGRLRRESRKIVFVPYCDWANRGASEMAVWLPRVPEKSRPLVHPGIEASAVVKASEGAKNLQAVQIPYQPESSGDEAGHIHWWPKKGGAAWIEYQFPAETTVFEAMVYWFDDTGTGECRVPASWRLLYKSGEDWLPVKNKESYDLEMNRYNTVRFDEVQTKGVRLELILQEKWSAGILRWRVQ